ncbi:hypothetical protein PT285_02245 [Lactobacillus sp. ESL0791]|uniref:hypothetical protein n=1 Tax=Lactobacillus sp. ESL0791 TaxID=2983234 RepID=UPI0023F86F1E|nr:hypothetical protein [Lactobacillus sp. ESL0791]MDF7638254.1 hypothetical protein [Lactobacillus sp. ESL0791]
MYERLAASKRQTKGNYLYSCIAEAEYQGHSFSLKLVYVTKRSNKGKYLVLALAAQTKAIIQLYGSR